MPDTPDAGTINPEALKAARQRQPGMTQQKLAEAVDCTKDTVSRWERGTSRRVQSRYREPLCKALRVKWEFLTRPPKKSSKPEDEDVPYHVWIKFLAGRGARTELHLVAERYNIHQWDVLKLAPLLFLIIAERSLLERSRRLKDIRAKMGEAEQSFPSHMTGIVVGLNEYGENSTEEEEESIEARDIFGLKLPAPWPEEDDWEKKRNPFINFIRDLARELPKDAVDEDSIETYGGAKIARYRIADDTLRECTGISEDDERGETLLSFIRMGGIDLAACLRAKRDRDDAGYRQWLSEALTQAEEEAKHALKEIEVLLDEEAPSAAENGGPTTAEERSEQ